MSITPTKTVRDLAWYTANANRVQELYAEAARLREIADVAAQAANDAAQDAAAMFEITEMFEGHPLRIIDYPRVMNEQVFVRSPLVQFVARAYRSQREGERTWSVNFEDRTYTSKNKAHLNRTPRDGNDVHDLTREAAILSAKRWVALGVYSR